MKLSDFHYELPPERIAAQPLADRAASRMLVVHREQGRWEDLLFRDLPLFLGPGDCLVLNDTKVFPSRLYGHRAGVHALPLGRNNPKRAENLSGRVEVLLLRPASGDRRTWHALVRPGRKLPVGESVRFAPDFEATVVARGEYGERTLEFRCAGDFYEMLDCIGHVPLPPYIRRPDAPDDRERYQTVYAREIGSVAAPTAGLHFTDDVLDRCRRAGAEIARITLHVGLGTFQPLHDDTVEQNRLHPESFEISVANGAVMSAAHRLVAVGTTSARAIESAALSGSLRECRGETGLFIYPGFQFQAVRALLTNFHLPQSSLLMLVCAFGGSDLILEAYRHAVEAEYRFYSYGDCMLVV